MARPAPQGAPRCFTCAEVVSAADAVFASPCGHEGCPSVIWHPLHYMDHLDAIEAHGAIHFSWLARPHWKQ